MKRGTRKIQSIEVDPVTGQPLTHAQLQHKKKYLDFSKVAFPEVNPFSFALKDVKSGKQLAMQTYRWPARGERRGIV